MKSKKHLSSLRQKASELIIEAMSALTLLAVILVMYNNNVIAILLCTIAGLALFLIKPNKTDLVGAMLASIIGPLADILSVNFESWQFANASFFGIPPWLPISWAVNFLLFRRLSQSLVNVGRYHGDGRIDKGESSQNAR